MRFFRDDESITLPVRWYFTKPDAQWVGVENTFDSRNWYLGEPATWPLLGEVQGAPRTWVDGVNPCISGLGPFGSAEQWADGALASEAIAEDPCKGPLVQPFGEFGCFFEYGGGGFPGIRWSPDLWYSDVVPFPGWWLTLQANAKGPGCCFERQGDFFLSDGPPAFNPLPFGQPVMITADGGCFDVHYSADGLPPFQWRVACS
jgi:hypothetical protein